MEYRILGPLEVRAGDGQVELRGVRQRELLAVLLLHANEIVSSDRLIDDLWQGDPPPTAAKIVQNSVSQLRRLLEPELLVTRSPGYLLRVEPGELDADRFERTVEQARADLAAGDAAKAAEQLREALGLEPSRALQRLERAVLAQDPSLELTPVVERAPEPAREEIPRPATRKTVSVVAADVLSLGGPYDPEALRRPMTLAVETVTGVLERHGASTEASTAGGVIGIFGLPTVHEDDALRAVRAATEARDALLELKPELERDWNVTVALRSGVNTGEVVAGNTAAHAIVAGDAVNVAARLQQAADPGEILLDEQTERLVRDAVRTEQVDPDALKATGRESAWRLLELAPEAPGYLRPLETPLVGRVDELDQLQQCFERAVEERAAKLFTVFGPAGIGKTRLARELVGSIAERASVLQGHCPSYGEGITFWPLREIVEQVGDLSAALEGEEDAEAIGDRILGAVGLSGQQTTNEEMFWAARKLFEALARRRPLVVLLEDAHSAEPALLDLVEHIVEWSSDAPIVFVFLGRSELVDERPRLAGGRANVVSVVLEPLTEQETDELLDALRGDIELSRETRARIATSAEGNPLFIEQMLAMVAEQGADGGGAVPIPPTIHALLAARLERLGSGERSILERGAVIGREFSRNALM